MAKQNKVFLKAKISPKLFPIKGNFSPLLNNYFDDEEEIILDSFCPCCYAEYDEIDYEYQICHLCGYNNNEEKKWKY